MFLGISTLDWIKIVLAVPGFLVSLAVIITSVWGIVTGKFASFMQNVGNLTNATVVAVTDVLQQKKQ